MWCSHSEGEEQGPEGAPGHVRGAAWVPGYKGTEDVSRPHERRLRRASCPGQWEVTARLWGRG